MRIFECFEIVTPESAESGDFADCGMVGEEDYTFREMVAKLRGAEPSSSNPGSNPHDWATVQWRTDYRTGAEESRSYHPMTARDARWFWKAWRHANKRKV